jgi:hypothetical protein
MKKAVLPYARALTLCDQHIGDNSGKVDLYGIFNSIHASQGYPFDRARFCVFAQLVNGLGKVPFFIDIRNAESDRVIRTTLVKDLLFPDRQTLIQCVMTIDGCRFPKAGLYLVELYCDNRWICDTQLLLT